MDVLDVSISASSSMDVQVVSLSTTGSMDPFYHQQYGRAGLSLSTTSSIYLQGASLSTASSMDVKGVSISIASSMDIQGVSHSTSSMANQDVSLSAASSMGVQDVSLSTTSSMDMQGVCIFFHLSKVFLKCRNAVLTGIFSFGYQRKNMLMPEPVMLQYQTEIPYAEMLMLESSDSMPCPAMSKTDEKSFCLMSSSLLQF
jgi:hypothetical protein